MRFDVKAARTLVVMTQPPSILSDELAKACDRIEFLESCISDASDLVHRAEQTLQRDSGE